MQLQNVNTLESVFLDTFVFPADRLSHNSVQYYGVMYTSVVGIC